MNEMTNEILHYLEFSNLSKNWEKYVFHRKNGILNPLGLCAYYRNFDLRKSPEYLYEPFDALHKQITCKMKALQVQAYIQ